MRRVMLVALFLVACVGDRRPADPASTNTCQFRQAGSRWVSASATYTPVAEFGHRRTEAFADIWGVATSPDGHVFVFDAGNTTVIRLDGDLKPVDRIGREGRGPGEFVYQRFRPGRRIAADDSSFFVLDLHSLSEFDGDGRFKRYPTTDPPVVLPVLGLASRSGRLLFATDDIDRQTGARSLSTWRLETSAPHTLLRRDPMPRLPKSRGRYVRGGLVDQAEPLWALHRRCAYVSDGAGDWILRADLNDDRADTLPLPQKEIPQRTREDERRLEEMRRAAARFGSRAGIGAGDDARATAVMKWRNLVVDPDGYVWLDPWRPASAQGRPSTAWIVNPATGAVDSMIVPNFPEAFLPSGAYVALARDTTLGSSYLRKYVLQPTGQ